ncbi:complement C5-like [Otolemur garnettii]|uniref:complement C5-like n=1 Tax=Otolemur garnettii TaxID=30611 RepID=UPI000C7F33B8|nr:complement C5-like [Otolemur garnettii]XP_023366348.1 complement C5-like [Otolemur garnettii]XP_023366349.1 complement C5-like [Otolemur garnettii]XP_023366350.1 complement C5-like [Otolemur garnettii]XP_023366351.1 complement C5-like [Otolemur garnettii]XP_023366352.1 complement C5-like [Otolemur garnettii]
MLQKKIEEAAAKYKHKILKKCCYDGSRLVDETCEQRVMRVTIGPMCRKAFNECCTIAEQFRTYKFRLLTISHMKSLLPVSKPEIRSYFPESWLWEVHLVPKRSQLQFMLPDVLTTWEIQSVGISDKGLCVADVLQLQVSKDHFLGLNDNATRVN